MNKAAQEGLASDGSLPADFFWPKSIAGPAVDVGPAARLVAKLSQAAIANKGVIQEMEFNPVILDADGSGVSVADALVVLKKG